MGLDQFANWIAPSDETATEEFWYWRKRNHVQNWMQKLYAKKTGISDPEMFNGTPLYLSRDDVLQFIDDTLFVRHECVGGFFFGNPYNPSEYMKDDMEFANECLKHLGMGRSVVYYASF